MKPWPVFNCSISSEARDMQLSSIPIERFLTELIDEIYGDQVVFLVGAGVSMLQPTSLPSGPALKSMAVSTICAIPQLKKYIKIIDEHEKFRAIVPELVFERFYEVLGERLLPFFQVLAHASPNLAHLVLASLFRQRKISVLTTNFDLLIDQHISRQDSVIHLHGCLADTNTLINRINKVGKGPDKVIVSQAHRKIKNRIVCILGYSGNDDDIRSILEASGARYVRWLVRNEEDIAWVNFEHLQHWDVPCIIAQGDLAVVFEHIARQFKIAARFFSRVDFASERQLSLVAWQNQLGLVDRFRCISKLLIDLGEYRHADKVSEQGTRHAIKVGQAAWFKNQSAYAMRMVGDFDRALLLSAEAIEVSKSESNYYELAAAYNLFGLALVEKEEHEPKRAVVYFRKALKQIKKVIDADPHRAEQVALSMGQFYNNLGLSFQYLGRFSDALKAYKKSLIIKRKHGALIGISQTCANISLIYYRQRKFLLAYRWRKNALEMIRKYQLRFQEAYLYREMGKVACEQGRATQGVAYLKHAVYVYEDIGDAQYGADITRAILGKYENPGLNIN